MRQQIYATSETADVTIGTYYCLYQRSTLENVGRSFKQPFHFADSCLTSERKLCQFLYRNCGTRNTVGQVLCFVFKQVR